MLFHEAAKRKFKVEIFLSLHELEGRLNTQEILILEHNGGHIIGTVDNIILKPNYSIFITLKTVDRYGELTSSYPKGKLYLSNRTP